MADPITNPGNKLVRLSRKKVLLIVIPLLVVAGLSVFYIQYRDSRKIPDNIDPATAPALQPAEFVAEENKLANSADVALTDKIARKTAAANYFSNIYEYEKVLEGLKTVAQEHPEAMNDHFYLTSYFTAALQLNRTDEVKVYAKKIVALEKTGVKSKTELPESLRKAIDENAL